MRETVLNKEVKVENNEVIITKSIETKMNQQQLEMQLQNLKMRRISLREQNKNILSEYDKILAEEEETKNLIEQLTATEQPLEEI